MRIYNSRPITFYFQFTITVSNLIFVIIIFNNNFLQQKWTP